LDGATWSMISQSNSRGTLCNSLSEQEIKPHKFRYYRECRDRRQRRLSGNQSAGVMVRGAALQPRCFFNQLSGLLPVKTRTKGADWRSEYALNGVPKSQRQVVHWGVETGRQEWRAPCAPRQGAVCSRTDKRGRNVTTRRNYQAGRCTGDLPSVPHLVLRSR
jgi:hypothetical protein